MRRRAVGGSEAGTSEFESPASAASARLYSVTDRASSRCSVRVQDAMLREFQDEIAQLKAALAAEDAIAAGLPPPPGYDPSVLQRMGLRAGGSGAGAMRAAGPPKVVKIEKIKTVTVGIAPEEMDKVRPNTNTTQHPKQQTSEGAQPPTPFLVLSYTPLLLCGCVSGSLRG